MNLPDSQPFLPAGRPIAARLLLAVLITACAGHHPSESAPAPRSAIPGIHLQDDWRATVLLERDDSIIITLPSGDKQLQRFDRRAGFTLAVDGDGKVSLRLDSLTFRPKSANLPDGLPGSSWTWRTADARMDALRVTGGGDAAAALSALVRDLLPRLPTAGVRARMLWADSATGAVRVDVFSASEHRIANWSTGSVTGRTGARVLPVLVREDFEQLGDGSQGGRRLTMTSQGRRTGTYYLTLDGRVSSAEMEDSVAMLIAIPATRQMVPTLRYARTSVRFIELTRDTSE